MGNITKVADFGLPEATSGQRTCKLPFLFLESHALDKKDKPAHKRRVQLVVTDFSARGTSMTRKNKKEERPLLYGLQETEVFCITVFEPVAEKWLPRELEKAAFITRKEAMGEYWSPPENMAFLDIELKAKIFRTGKGCYWEGKSNGPFQAYTLEELKKPSQRLLFKYGLLDRLKDRMRYSRELLEAYESTFFGSEMLLDISGQEFEADTIEQEREEPGHRKLEVDEMFSAPSKRRKVTADAPPALETKRQAGPEPETPSCNLEEPTEVGSDSGLLEDSDEDNEEFIRAFQTSQGFQLNTQDLGDLSDLPEDTQEDALEDNSLIAKSNEADVVGLPIDLSLVENTEDVPEKLNEHSKLERVGEVIRTGLSSFSNTIRTVFPRRLRSSIRDAYPDMVTPTQDKKNDKTLL